MLSSKASPASEGKADGYGVTAIKTHRAVWHPWKAVQKKRYSAYKPLLA